MPRDQSTSSPNADCSKQSKRRNIYIILYYIILYYIILYDIILHYIILLYYNIFINGRLAILKNLYIIIMELKFPKLGCPRSRNTAGEWCCSERLRKQLLARNITDRNAPITADHRDINGAT